MNSCQEEITKQPAAGKDGCSGGNKLKQKRLKALTKHHKTDEPGSGKHLLLPQVLASPKTRMVLNPGQMEKKCSYKSEDLVDSVEIQHTKEDDDFFDHYHQSLPTPQCPKDKIL